MIALLFSLPLLSSALFRSSSVFFPLSNTTMTAYTFPQRSAEFEHLVYGQFDNALAVQAEGSPYRTWVEFCARYEEPASSCEVFAKTIRRFVKFVVDDAELPAPGMLEGITSVEDIHHPGAQVGVKSLATKILNFVHKKSGTGAPLSGSSSCSTSDTQKLVQTLDVNKIHFLSKDGKLRDKSYLAKALTSWLADVRKLVGPADDGPGGSGGTIVAAGPSVAAGPCFCAL